MPRLLFLVSSATSMTLADGTSHVTGYFADEALKPYDRFVAAGVDVVVATPDGRPPTPDPYGLEPRFHFPDEDEDFLASVVRSFMPDADDVRVTLQQLTEQDLIAARRVFVALTGAGMDPEEARRAVEGAARAAWRDGRSFVDVLGEDGAVTSLVPAARLRELAEEVRARRGRRLRPDARPVGGAARLPASGGSGLADRRARSWPSTRVFIPGGHGPMVDMTDNPDVGRALRLLHDKDATVAALCHGPAALLAAGDRPDGHWVFDGYKLTSFTDEEEDQTEAGMLGMPWYLESALKNAGGVFDDAPSAWVSHVVVDRNLITAQNPMSADAVGRRRPRSALEVL